MKYEIKTKEMIINYGTIKNMKVQMPIGVVWWDQLLEVWVKGFIEYMTTDCICSDEVLCSSIGQHYALEALVEGLKERVKDESSLKSYINYVSDEVNWRFEVIKQRRGLKAAIIDKFDEDFFQRFYNFDQTLPEDERMF